MDKRSRRITSSASSKLISGTLIFLVTILLEKYRCCTAFVPAWTTCKHATRRTKLDLFRGLETAKEKRYVKGDVKREANGKVNEYSNTKKIPFIVERLGDRPGDEVFKGIAEMCISVFFNNGKQGRAMPPWKEVQLSYLRMIQMADLRRRRARDTMTNAMFVAYKVEEAPPDAAQSKPLILKVRDVNNLNEIATGETTDFVRGEVLGFCEVSMVPFGLAPVTMPPLPNGHIYDTAGGDKLNSRRLVPKRMRNTDIPRPVLTNLSVKVEARASGVGSKLLQACERTASVELGRSELCLEVEDDNVAARIWYQKRGYRVLFSDPTSRRYDVSGLFLKKVGCTRQILRKSLNSFSPPEVSGSSLNSFGGLNKAFKRLRENML